MNYSEQTVAHLLDLAEQYMRKRDEERAQTLLLFALVKATIADGSTTTSSAWVTGRTTDDGSA